MKKLRESRLMFWSVWLLVIASLIFISTKISFVFYPVTTFIATLFLPILTAGFLYYIFEPLIKLLEKIKIKRIYGIVLVMVLFIGTAIFTIMNFLPKLGEQLGNLINSIPMVISKLEILLTDLDSQSWTQEIDITKIFDNAGLSIENISNVVLSSATASLSSLFGFVANTAIFVATVPIILFYMFRDGDKLPQAMSRFIPKDYRTEMIGLMGEMNKTISSYISGQALVCVFVGTFTYLGYLLVGQDYAMLFGFIAGVTNIIPYIGPFAGAAPAVILALTVSPTQTVLTALVVLIVQQIDANLLSPNIIGKTLDIHPLTIIIILLVAGKIAGLIGLILAVPTYAVVKTITEYIYNMFTLREKYKQYKNTIRSPFDAPLGGSYPTV